MFTSFDSFEADPSSPADLHKYLYADSDPVDGTDPSGEFVFPLDLIYGRIVHAKIGADFAASGPGRVSNLSINRILGTKKIYFGLLRPDLTDTVNHQVYEIKPITSYLAGLSQLGTYVLTLNRNDPKGAAWIFGRSTNYTPPSEIQVNPVVYAFVNPPEFGVITYELVDFPQLFAIAASLIISDLSLGVSAAGLTTALIA